MRATGLLCLITCHPFLSDWPSRIAALERFVVAREDGDIALHRCDRLARRLVQHA